MPQKPPRPAGNSAPPALAATDSSAAGRRIEAVIAHPLRATLPTPQRTSQATFASIEIVVVEIRTADGVIQEIRAAWVAGCDGARSAVRTLNDIPFVGAPYEQVFFVADVRVTGPMVPEELNVFDVAGGTVNFGFPECWSQGGPACRGKIAPLVKLPAHASSDGLAVTEDWAGGGLTAFVAQNGSSFSASGRMSSVRVCSTTGMGAVRSLVWRFLNFCVQATSSRGRHARATPSA